jgi:protein SCO1/2
MERRGLFLGAAAALVASGGSYFGSTRQSTAGPRAGYFPNVALRTHEGKSVLFYDDLIAGKFVVINFMYTGCGDICPGMTANLVEVQRLLGERVGRDIFMYSITLSPELDTPEILRGYAETFGVQPGWLFLTGRRDDVELLRRKLGFIDPDPVADADQTQHIGIVKFGIERLDRWAGCPALANPEQIVRSIRWLEGRKGSSSDDASATDQ